MEPSSRPPLTDSAWEDLQRDCHPFPAYVDYLYGRPTGFEDAQPCEPLPLSGLQQAALDPTAGLPSAFRSALSQFDGRQIPAPSQARQSTPAYLYQLQTPAQNSSSRQFLRDFHSTAGLPNGQNDGYQPRPPTRVIPQPAPAAMPGGRTASDQPPAPIIRPHELLQEEYSWLSDEFRQIWNDKIVKLYSIVNNSEQPLEQRLKAKQAIIDESARAHLAKAKHIIHAKMPNVWRALKVRQAFSPGDPMHLRAEQNLRNFTSNLELNANLYVQHLIDEMGKAEAEGRNPLEVIPGYQALPVQQHGPAQQALMQRPQYQQQNPPLQSTTLFFHTPHQGAAPQAVMQRLQPQQAPSPQSAMQAFPSPQQSPVPQAVMQGFPSQQGSLAPPAPMQSSPPQHGSPSAPQATTPAFLSQQQYPAPPALMKRLPSLMDAPQGSPRLSPHTPASTFQSPHPGTPPQTIPHTYQTGVTNAVLQKRPDSAMACQGQTPDAGSSLMLDWKGF
ncbi:hypothetical protein BU26DRAFT_289517 [Trematosphaeria pertusa]|uniref:Uncharacterized protein n=1 Tax=Trematosphaeria pertusa TaxID=390896 RepID=A0A6A6IJS8_9PLEO|nr:uncharacterized protein BU26DRAFT_289517 [Trematosphaeria pertusa]KAF2249793.1 hypothetical protein BU26DRAFT_289517 [Trematosphaeria pertusa]